MLGSSRDLWDMLQNGYCREDTEGYTLESIPGLIFLAERNFGESMPEVGLIVAVMVQAARDVNNGRREEDVASAIKYFNGWMFELDCRIIGLDPKYVRKLINRIWEIENTTKGA